MNLQFSPTSGLSSTAVLLAVLFITGCASVHRVNSEYDTTFGKKRATTNVYQTASLPGDLSRVALLPFYKGNYEHLSFHELEENFRLELIDKRLFEVVTIGPETMKEMFPEARYSSVEYLPTDLLTKLSSRYDIDGLMLVDVSYFNAYQPVGLGVRAKLLNGNTGELIWAVDEVFDASDPRVSNSARKFYKTESIIQYPLHNTRTALHSPNRFSKYVAHSLFSAINLQKD